MDRNIDRKAYDASGFTSPDGCKTLAKCIDEFNFCTITIPLSGNGKQAADV